MPDGCQEELLPQPCPCVITSEGDEFGFANRLKTYDATNGQTRARQAALEAVQRVTFGGLGNQVHKRDCAAVEKTQEAVTAAPGSLADSRLL
jgi:hypothetical protein